jgi:tetratricopeptide (TPR) repeat protein
MLLTPELLRGLESELLGRNIEAGFHLLANAIDIADHLSPENPFAASYLLHLAQWVDLGYRDISFLEGVTGRLASVVRSDMKVADYLQLRMTEAFLAFGSEDASTAISIIEGVLGLQPNIASPGLLTTAHFWKGRAHRKRGEYELALRHILEAKRLAAALDAPKTTAVIQVHESWLLFQRGQRKDAFRLLDEAEQELRETDDALSQGNIESARGRFVRRSGEYGKALAHFDRAIATYSSRFPNHRNLARALVNAAYVKRLVALDLSHASNEGRARGDHHLRRLEICQDALELLKRAGEIYAQHHHQSGTGSVLVNAGHLHLDSGDIERASEEATKAFQLGEEKQDHILMARARILQSAIHNVRVEEQLGEPEDIANHANLAAQYADEAIDISKETQNRRLLAGAYIARGSTAANEFFEEWELAKQFASQAGDLLSRDDRDHLSKELLMLKTRILRAIGINHTLRAWSDGLTGDKTFQQIVEDFEEIVIPKVWLREGRKISKVAERLSISPKKVRRVLRSINLLDKS